LIDVEYTRHPFYGSRKMVVHQGKVGHLINRKRVQRLMRILGLAGMAPGPNTSLPHYAFAYYDFTTSGVTSLTIYINKSSGIKTALFKNGSEITAEASGTSYVVGDLQTN
jgi:hypothetical protein